MPSKYRKRRRKKKTPPVFEFELFFDDVTMTDAEGEFARVKAIMEQDMGGGWEFIPHLKQYRRKGTDHIPRENWCIRTKLTITHPMGEGNFLLNLFNDGKIAIVQYHGNTADASYNPDVRCLTKWSQAAGWKIPEPLPELISEAHRFWKTMWETLLVDSEYLDNRYGLRKSMMIRDKQQEEEEEDEAADE